MEFAKPHVSNIRNSNIRDLLTKVSKRKIGAQYLAEVRLSKIRHYSEATIRFDFPVTALIGTNGGGKSTVLGAAGLIYRSVAPRTFFVKSGKYDQSMQDWTLTYEHWDQQGKLIVRTARYSKARWNRDPIDRSVVLLGVSRTLPATERKRLTAAIGNKFTGVAERPLSQEAQDSVEKILGRDISSYITVDIDGSGQEDRQFFASQSGEGIVTLNFILARVRLVLFELCSVSRRRIVVLLFSLKRLKMASILLQHVCLLTILLMLRNEKRFKSSSRHIQMLQLRVFLMMRFGHV